MPGALVWDKSGERFYETGVRKGVLYVQDESGAYPKGVAWNGLTNMTVSPSGAEPTALYADDIKYLTLMSAEEFGGTIEAYSSPKEFDECDGTAEAAKGVFIGQQNRKTFGMAWQSIIGNDVKGENYGYKLHLVYGALASPSEKSYASLNDSPEVDPLSWEYTTTPVNVSGHKPTAYIVIDSTKADPTKLAALEKKLFGDSAAEAQLPLPDEVITMMTTEEP